MDGQITFLPTEENTHLEVVQMQFVDVHNTCAAELFSGFNHLYAITFACELGFIESIIDDFDTAEIIVGCEAMVKFELQEIMAFQTRALEIIKKRKRLVERVAADTLTFWVAKDILSHQKVYVLMDDYGNSRVIVGSANLSTRAFSGHQRENIGFFENDTPALEFYLNEFETLKDFSTNEVVKDALYINTDNKEKVLENLPILAEAKVKNVGVILDNDVSSANRDAIEFVYDIKALADKYAGIMPKLEKQGNKVLFTSSKVTELMRKFKKTLQEEEQKRKVHPQFIVNYNLGTFSLNGTQYDLNTDLEAVANDLYHIAEYYSGFDTFIGNTDQAKQAYFQLMNYMFLSPFIARLRYQAYTNSFAVTAFPLYAVVNGPKSAGKSAFMDTVQGIMFGKKLGGISPSHFTKTGIYGLLRESSGVPLHIEDIVNDRFRNYCGEIVKYDDDLIKEKLFNHPVIIMTANDIESIKPDYAKRVYYSSVNAQLTNVTAVSRHKKMSELRKKISTAFYREYLRRMYPKVVDLINKMDDFVLNESNESWQPDIFNISSKTIIEIYEACGLTIPEYVRELTYFDYFGYNSLAQNAKDKIVFEWTHNRKAFKVMRKQNRLEYIAGEHAYEAGRLCDSLPEVLQAKRSGTKVVLQLDEAEKFFGIHFKIGLF